MLGSSPITSILGLIVIVAGVISEVLTDEGLPTDAAGWFRLGTALVTGIALRYAKDYNVTNSKFPGDAKTIEAPPTQVAPTLLLLVLVGAMSGCASFVEKCHEFSKYVDIKAIDCAPKAEPAKP